MGRWRLHDHGQRQMMSTVALLRDGSSRSLSRLAGAGPYLSADRDTSRIWWKDVGVPQNLTFPVHPDPISGQHCWHQAVRVRRAQPGDRAGEVAVDVQRARDEYQAWMARTRPAGAVSPDGTRRPYWLLRPLKPAKDVYALPAEAGASTR
jgi:hypothetical protein